MNSKGFRKLSPASDLTFSNGPGGVHSMTIDGEGKTPTLQNILNAGIKGGILKKEL